MGDKHENFRVIKTEEELKVFNDPYRMKIIKTFQKSEDPLTVKACADIMGEVPAKIHYHVKKLIDIEILELDHVEVINGINAKYYKLPKRSFTISLEDSEDDNSLSHLSHVHTIISNMIDEFKDSFMKSTAKAAEEKLKEAYDAGFIVSNSVELTKEEFKEVSEYITEIKEKYKHTKDDGTEKVTYTLFAGLSKEIK
jgi:predicted ArsR family transcriptional regulator